MTSRTPLLSVVIPLYNAESEIRICLDSIFRSNWANFEVIIVDDCSTDNSRAVAGQYPCRIYSTESNSGPAKARNIGVAEAKSDHILFLDSDTEVKADSLRMFSEAFREYPEIVAVIAVPEVVSLRQGRASNYNSLRNHFTLVSADPINDYFTTQMGAIRKDAFIEAGGFNEKYTGADIEDIEFGLRLPSNKVLIHKGIVIGHHFPPLFGILKKYLKRAYLLARLLRERKKLTGAHADKKGMLSVGMVLCSALFLFLTFINLSFIIGYFISSTLFMVINLDLFLFCTRKKGAWYFVEAVFFEFVFSMAIGLGGVASWFMPAVHLSDIAKKYLDLARMFVAGDPTYMIFYVTSQCNSRCKTCFNWNYNTAHRADEELSLDEIGKIARNTGRLNYVTLGGGEPFLRADIADICKIFYDNNHTRIFSIPTNCLTPQPIVDRTEAILKKCPGSVVRVSMSIDGIGAVHDFIRGVAGNFDKVIQTYGLLNQLRERYQRLEILANTTFCKFNQDSIREIHSYVTNHFRLDMYGLTLIRGNARNPDVGRVDMAKYAEAVRLFEEGYFRNKGEKRHPLQRILTILPIFTRREVIKTAEAPRRTYECHAVRKQIVVDSFGDVFACEMLPGKLGNLRESGYDLRAVLEKPEVMELVKSINRRECNCTWECAIQNSMALSVKKYPAMFYESFIK